MPCHAAMIDKHLTVSEDEEVGKVLKALKKNKTPAAAIINADGELSGLFSHHILLTNLLPVNVSVAGLSVGMEAAPGVAKRLRKVKALPVKDLMSTKFGVVHPETPTWEGLKLILESANPVIVIDQTSKKPLGMITEESIYEEFERMQD